eukprot:m.296049 g.296049  ORF g.296049 m.296049 type:complete len:467 (-) comp19519_c2_seq1:96-1496(-)
MCVKVWLWLAAACALGLAGASTGTLVVAPPPGCSDHGHPGDWTCCTSPPALTPHEQAQIANPNDLIALASCRDRRAWPFATTSIWNTAIGSNANYTPAGVFSPQPRARGCMLAASQFQRRQTCASSPHAADQATCEAAGCCWDNDAKSKDYLQCFAAVNGTMSSFHIDQDIFVEVSDSDPEIAWHDQGWWGPNPKNATSHCSVVGPVHSHIKFPHNVTFDLEGHNSGLAMLQPDNRTLLQTQPAYRCVAGGPLLSRYPGCPWGCVYQSILGDGAHGAHGGSGLSAFGGTIRPGELLAHSGPIRHALKLELYAHEYYYGGKAAPTFRWPALGSDGYTHQDSSPLRYNGTNPLFVPGALLAIPPGVGATLDCRSVPACKIRDALVDYGAYVVDDTAEERATLCMDLAVPDEVTRAYNMTIQDVRDPTSPWLQDMHALFVALQIVANNGPQSIGGGGTPRQPPAPPMCP